MNLYLNINSNFNGPDHYIDNFYINLMRVRTWTYPLNMRLDTRIKI